MDLARSDEEESARRVVADLLGAQCPIERVRKAEPLGYDAELWATVESAAQSLDGAMTTLAVIAEEIGRFLAPVPFVDVAVTRRLLARCDPTLPVEAALPTLAVRPAVGRVASLVPAGAIASHVVALTSDGLVLAPTEPNGFGVAPLTLGCAPVGDRTVAGPGVSVLAVGPAAVLAHARAVDEWRVLTAAALIGLAQGAFDRAVERVRERTQFGVAIGTFQVVQHRLADLATELDGARLLGWEAAWEAEQAGARSAALASMAWVFAAETAVRIATESLHLHGGVGYTLAGDTQLFFRRAKAWSLLLDDPERELALLGDRLYGPAR